MTAEIFGAHLVGSAPVDQPQQIFTLASERLGPHLCRLGDGEVGERDTWIRFQNARLGASPQLESKPPDPELARTLPQGYSLPPVWSLTDEALLADQIELPDLGYARAALSSYRIFRQMKEDGRIPEHMRFMVGLPSPLSVVTIYVDKQSRGEVLKAYASALLDELARILEGIPHSQLCVQWEVVFEIMMLEGHPLWSYHGADVHTGIRAQFTEMLKAVPASAEMGLHLCYGDAGHKHFLEPTDSGILTQLANLACEVVERPLDYIHIPVPRERDDQAYFEPLRDLKLTPETDLYLGLVHFTDGDEGTLARIETASNFVDRFGIATECGFGRRSPETLEALLDLHARVVAGL